MYSDAGLLGAMVVCEASSAGKVVGAVAAALRNAQASKCFMTSLLFKNHWFSWLPFHGIPKLMHELSRSLMRRWLQQRRTCWLMFTPCLKLPSTRSRTWDPKWITNSSAEPPSYYNMTMSNSGFDVWRGYARRKSSGVDCWNHNSRCTGDQSIPWGSFKLSPYVSVALSVQNASDVFLPGCCQEAIISEIEYGSLWKPINSTFPRLPMSPRSYSFKLESSKLFLGPLELRCRGWSLWRILNPPDSFFCVSGHPIKDLLKGRPTWQKFMKKSFEYLSWWWRATFCGNMSGILRSLINWSYVSTSICSEGVIVSSIPECATRK